MPGSCWEAAAVRPLSPALPGTTGPDSAATATGSTVGPPATDDPAWEPEFTEPRPLQTPTSAWFPTAPETHPVELPVEAPPVEAPALDDEYYELWLIEADGEDAEQAIQALLRLIADRFGEGE